MTISEDTSKRKDSLRTKKGKESLPWWVELLFVQIGLPEKFLRKILQLKAKTKEHFEEKRSRYYTISLIIFLVIYINPIINNAKYTNKCIRITKDILVLKSSESNKGEINAFSKAVSHCNGSNSLK